ncbi:MULTISPECIES: hypothetical protein [Burkholderia]|uniref:hypothetical protein n=1 Tax=Burkholderia TaxID=32008 RepID=UPI000AB7CB06|nr:MULTISPECIES: hypothetical protein [Burkholderia]
MTMTAAAPRDAAPRVVTGGGPPLGKGTTLVQPPKAVHRDRGAHAVRRRAPIRIGSRRK